MVCVVVYVCGVVVWWCGTDMQSVGYTLICGGVVAVLSQVFAHAVMQSGGQSVRHTARRSAFALAEMLYSILYNA